MEWYRIESNLAAEELNGAASSCRGIEQRSIERQGSGIAEKGCAERRQSKESRDKERPRKGKAKIRFAKELRSTAEMCNGQAKKDKAMELRRVAGTCSGRARNRGAREKLGAELRWNGLAAKRIEKHSKGRAEQGEAVQWHGTEPPGMAQPRIRKATSS